MIDNTVHPTTSWKLLKIRFPYALLSCLTSFLIPFRLYFVTSLLIFSRIFPTILVDTLFLNFDNFFIFFSYFDIPFSILFIHFVLLFHIDGRLRLLCYDLANLKLKILEDAAESIVDLGEVSE